MLVTSYPIIEKYANKIIFALKIVDKHNIHPAILQQLYSNLIHNAYIISFTEDNNKINDKNFVIGLTDINADIEIIFSVFLEIYRTADEKFIKVESLLGFNNMSASSSNEFDKLSIEFMDKDCVTFVSNPTNNSLKLNILLININHGVEYAMNEYSSSICDSVKKNDSSVLTHKYDADIDTIFKFNALYEKLIKSQYESLRRFGIFNDINIVNIIDLLGKNILYYWIDTIASLNGIILDSLLKRS
jgi:hypothetical protein